MKSQIQKEIVFLLVLTTISFIIDVMSLYKNVYCKCKAKQQTLIVLYIHHFIAVFWLFGWLAESIILLKLHIIGIIFTFLIQMLNNGKCPLTEFVNNRCYDKSKYVYLRDLVYFANCKEPLRYFTLKGICFSISLYKLKMKNVNLFKL